MKFFTFFVLFVFLQVSLCAQEIAIVTGNYKNLKTIPEYNLVFDYSDLSVTDFENEEAYLQKTMFEKEEAKPGNARVFREEWFGDREYRYEPRYVEAFNHILKREK